MFIRVCFKAQNIIKKNKINCLKHKKLFTYKFIYVYMRIKPALSCFDHIYIFLVHAYPVLDFIYEYMNFNAKLYKCLIRLERVKSSVTKKINIL